jgi:hypothetical protein
MTPLDPTAGPQHDGLIRLTFDCHRTGTLPRRAPQACAAAPPAASTVVVHRLDGTVLVPEVVRDDASGIVHMVYGTAAKDAFYMQSTSEGASSSWSRPIKLNSANEKVCSTMGERGPKIALGPGGAIHVVWMDDWHPGASVHVRAVRSIDRGASFSSAVAASDTDGVDGANVAVDGNGTVLVFWHDLSHPGFTTSPPNASSATWLWYAKSANGGVSFDVSQRVTLAGGKPAAAACSMCMTSPRTGADGRVTLAYRSADNNVRDFVELFGDGSANAWSATGRARRGSGGPLGPPWSSAV